jgi:putative membrane protein
MMQGEPHAPAGPGMSPDEISVELSSRRTGMSFQRTRMSADRTLMSVIRTSLSLISFGFTIYQFFGKLAETQGFGSAPARRFGFALVLLGVTMLVVGIAYHLAFMAGLRHEREQMKIGDLIHAESRFPVSMTLIVAVLLLVTGLLSIVSMVFRVGPFG